MSSSTPSFSPLDLMSLSFSALPSVSVYVRLQEGIETGHVVLGKVVLSGYLVF